jgi:hypothetical protein
MAGRIVAAARGNHHGGGRDGGRNHGGGRDYGKGGGAGGGRDRGVGGGGGGAGARGAGQQVVTEQVLDQLVLDRVAQGRYVELSSLLADEGIPNYFVSNFPRSKQISRINDGTRAAINGYWYTHPLRVYQEFEKHCVRIIKKVLRSTDKNLTKFADFVVGPLHQQKEVQNFFKFRQILDLQDHKLRERGEDPQNALSLVELLHNAASSQEVMEYIRDFSEVHSDDFGPDAGGAEEMQRVFDTEFREHFGLRSIGWNISIVRFFYQFNDLRLKGMERKLNQKMKALQNELYSNVGNQLNIAWKQAIDLFVDLPETVSSAAGSVLDQQVARKLMASSWKYVANNRRGENNLLKQLQGLRDLFGFSLENSLPVMIGNLTTALFKGYIMQDNAALKEVIGNLQDSSVDANWSTEKLNKILALIKPSDAFSFKNVAIKLTIKETIATLILVLHRFASLKSQLEGQKEKVKKVKPQAIEPLDATATVPEDNAMTEVVEALESVTISETVDNITEEAVSEGVSEAPSNAAALPEEAQDSASAPVAPELPVVEMNIVDDCTREAFQTNEVFASYFQDFSPALQDMMIICLIDIISSDSLEMILDIQLPLASSFAEAATTNPDAPALLPKFRIDIPWESLLTQVEENILEGGKKTLSMSRSMGIFGLVIITYRMMMSDWYLQICDNASESFSATVQRILSNKKSLDKLQKATHLPTDYAYSCTMDGSEEDNGNKLVAVEVTANLIDSSTPLYSLIQLLSSIESAILEEKHASKNAPTIESFGHGSFLNILSRIWNLSSTEESKAAAGGAEGVAVAEEGPASGDNHRAPVLKVLLQQLNDGLVNKLSFNAGEAGASAWDENGESKQSRGAAGEGQERGHTATAAAAGSDTPRTPYSGGGASKLAEVQQFKDALGVVLERLHVTVDHNHDLSSLTTEQERLTSALQLLVLFEFEFRQEVMMPYNQQLYAQLVRLFRTAGSSSISAPGAGFTVLSYLTQLLEFNVECQEIWHTSSFAKRLMTLMQGSSLFSDLASDNRSASGKELSGNHGLISSQVCYHHDTVVNILTF